MNTQSTEAKPLLRFSHNNAKVDAHLFSIPAGETCPFAMQCLSTADRITGHITDGPDTKYRCYKASLEAAFKGVRDMAWANFDALDGLSTTEMASLITLSLPHDATRIRIHEGGDFYSASYFRAWKMVAERHTHITFYAYTKSLYLIVKYGQNPCANFHLVASRGGKLDALIDKHAMKEARVVSYATRAEARLNGHDEADTAEAWNLPVDHDDSHAYTPSMPTFALVLHGTQPKGTPAAIAWKHNKANGHSYSAKRKAVKP